MRVARLLSDTPKVSIRKVKPFDCANGKLGQIFLKDKVSTLRTSPISKVCKAPDP